MEGPQKHNINELLTQGFFTTRRGKSPSRPTALPRESSFLRTPSYEAPRDRSRSRTRRRPPPRPTAEDEAVSLAKEYSKTARRSSYDPPLRGIIDQVPIILEADVTKTEAARLQAQPIPKSTDDNPEKRFVLIPKSDTYSPNEEDGPQNSKGKNADTSQTPKAEVKRDEKKDTLPKPPIARRRSRLDLPSLETKLPKEIPPQYRRSASAYGSTPKEHDETPKAQGSRPSESFLSPAVSRGKKDYFGSAPAPRQSAQETFGGRAANGNNSSSRPVSPIVEKRHSGNLESYRSRYDTNEKVTKSQQLSEEYGSRRNERHPSTHSDRLSAGRSSRSSNRSSRHYHSSSSDEIADSDSDKEHKRYEHKSHKAIREEDGYDRHLRSPSRSNRSSIERKGTSKYNSPYASPKLSPSQIPKDQLFERSETFPSDRRRDISRPVSPLSPGPDAPRTDRLNPLEATKSRPRSRSSAAAPRPQAAPLGLHPSLPIPIPIPSRVDPPGETRKSPVIPPFDEQRSATARPPANPKPDWNPGTFQPPSNNLQKPVGSFRRYSEDMERGSIAPLPSCPRTNYTRGRNDWLTLPNCPSFDICPSCFTSSIAPTDFRTHFVPAPRRPADTAVLCDFGSSPWYRIAWLLTLKEKRQNLKLFYGLANIAANEPPCLGKHEAARKWHSIIDPKTGSDIYNFDVCYSCVKSIEVLLPAIKGIFVRTDSQSPSFRVCDLRFDSPRFIQYFDALEVAADRADYHHKDPDTRDLASLARRFAKLDECPQSTDLVDKKMALYHPTP
ncbi:hypothetical protein LSUB1_G007730 [Lachnellula subtilissima]|uniref:Uncharacterized protein n=1 Tax=Lachnellula subtilissima TaxID=602034 RepID=A0A8H8RDI0_9HELO|nr:hypothetical protein LSUB1_G007730 [Lachnellula subtilissima]